LRLEDPSISTYLPTEEYPINFVRLKKPIQRNRGYVIYEFTSDLFSRYRAPRPEKAPTTLIAIPEYHAHEEADHLLSQPATIHQRVLEVDYALPPLRTWENEWSPRVSEAMSAKWSEEMDRVCESARQEQEREMNLMM
jgi:hypothetical protein